MYAFGSPFYTNRLTMHSKYTLYQCMHSLVCGDLVILVNYIFVCVYALNEMTFLQMQGH